MPEKASFDVIPTGVPGLDDVLRGGLTAGKMYLVSGAPGTGKTTLALQFIAEGIRRGERCLYISIGGAGEDLLAQAEAMNIFLDPMLFSLHAAEINEEILTGPEERIFHSSETELSNNLTNMLTEVKRVQPKRLVIDSLSALRSLTDDLVSYRRMVLALQRECFRGDYTVIFVNYGSPTDFDLHMETACHGVVYLQQSAQGYGPVRRRLMVPKFRRRAYRTGWHDFAITTDGICVFPTLIPSEHRQKKEKELVPSGNEHLDALLYGGLNRGSSVAIIGASGTGKTTLANTYAVAAARRGEHVAIYLFDETDESFLERAEGMGLAVDSFIESGLLKLRQIDVGELSPGQFTSMIRGDVEEKDASLIVIDTLNGYRNAMQDERAPTIQLHELLTYLMKKGVTALIAVEQHGIFGSQAPEVKDMSYIADTIILMRFFEQRGRVRRAISVTKKRRGKHEATIRELSLTEHGIAVGEPLEDMQGVLTGVPTIE